MTGVFVTAALGGLTGHKNFLHIAELGSDDND